MGKKRIVVVSRRKRCESELEIRTAIVIRRLTELLVSRSFPDHIGIPRVKKGGEKWLPKQGQGEGSSKCPNAKPHELRVQLGRLRLGLFEEDFGATWHTRLLSKPGRRNKGHCGEGSQSQPRSRMV